MSLHLSPTLDERCDTESSRVMLPCPTCGSATDSVKHYPFLVWGFLVIAVSVERQIVAGCPKCIRRQVLSLAGIQILTANVLWPFVVLPALLLRLITSCRVGHLPPDSARAGWLSVAAFLTGAFAVLLGLGVVFAAKPIVILLFLAAVLIYAGIVALAFASDG